MAYSFTPYIRPGYDVKLQPGRGGEAVRGVSKSQLTSTKSAQMAVLSTPRLAGWSAL